VPYEQLFTLGKLVEMPEGESYSYYPNRNSLSYIPLYKLEEAQTFIRTTLRHPDFCFGWKNIIDLKLTDETAAYNTDGMTIADFFRIHFEKHGFSKWLNDMRSTRLSFAKDIMQNLIQLIESEEEAEEEDQEVMLVNEKGELNTVEVEDLKDAAAAEVARKMHEANLSLKQLFFLGLDSDETIDKGFCSAADVLQFVMEKKLKLEPADKDLVVMVHELDYELNGEAKHLKSWLTVKGKDDQRTAMAKAVGLPLGIAAKLILQGRINQTGLHIPIASSIYGPVLNELKEHNITFHESTY